MQVPVEGFFLESRDGLIHDVKGISFVPGWVVSYVRYVPVANKYAEGSLRRKHGTELFYRKVYSFADREETLRTFPDHHFDFSGTRFQGTRLSEICSLYDPEERAKEILMSPRADDLVAADARTFLETIRDSTSIQNVGVTGSVLVGLHYPSSDLDFVVYGENAGRTLYDEMGELLEANNPLRRYSVSDLRALYEFRRQDTPAVNFKSFLALEAHKRLQGIFRQKGRCRHFYVRLVKTRSASPMLPFRVLGDMRITARVEDDHDAIFTPCCYVIKDVLIEEGPKGLEQVPLEIISFRGRFTDLAQRDDVIRALGAVEVVPQSPGCRLVVGGEKSHYMVKLDE